MAKSQIYTDEKNTTWKLEYIPTSHDCGYYCGTIVTVRGRSDRKVGNQVSDDSLKELIETIENLK